MTKPVTIIREKNSITIVELLPTKILDEPNIGKVTDALLTLANEKQPLRLLLSFAHVEFLSSIMLGTLIRVSKHVVEGGGVIKLCCISPNLYEMFVITRLHLLFDIYADEETALRSFDN